MEPSRQLPAIGAPAARALAEAGVQDVDDLRRVGLDHLATLHGVGPKALRLLRQALDAADDDVR
ncbi:helix-hairpin-helix domain-containing protein [Rathayibacter festucae]|uniref:helix-hairpin-helix domain-containing protein n=1 Tax=Rathayibacter festucae TaxID=110937 RepID=UPI002A69E355|nr:helix-hairpin-helix domain-containing protein [Rathayibacter festucae]MDY0913686.1 helix-hairpin-helix domain-containing protein [Rathayibacter festucae]